jgi:hypothetical protein
MISIFVLYSCEDGPVEPNIVIDSKEDALRQELRLKKRFEDRNSEKRSITTNAITSQGSKRVFLQDSAELEHTDIAKVDYYLNKAIDADKNLAGKTAIKYAEKVLELDPNNSEAIRIAKKNGRVFAINKTFNNEKLREANYKNDINKMKQEVERDLMNASMNGQIKEKEINKIRRQLKTLK